MDVRCAVGLPNVGEFGDVRVLRDLAVSAEASGWDGVHLWDHVLYHEAGWAVTSPIVAASVIAAATQRLRIILTVTLPRRQVQDVARDTAAIDELSGRRLTLVAILGSMDREYTEFGLSPDLRVRARALDERLAGLVDLWSRWNVPRIPIWCGGPGRRRPACAARPVMTAPCPRSPSSGLETSRSRSSVPPHRSSGDWRLADSTSLLRVLPRRPTERLR
jgi:alkanesulfonate monooxygenase SsuD/methylene tetrahydromethanopterin reductase-like flavin-dependent oxidoreductase (luciferase family)